MGTQSPHFFLLLLLTVTIYNLHTTAVAVSSPAAVNSDAAAFIRTSCGITLYPSLCVSSLSSYINTIQHNHGMLARAAITVSLSRAQSMASYVSNLCRETNKNTDPRTASALRDCANYLGSTVDNIRGSLKQMQQMRANSGDNEQFRFQMSNVQTWMSTAMTDGQACREGLNVAPDGRVKTDVCDRVMYVKKFISNALALVDSYANGGKP